MRVLIAKGDGLRRAKLKRTLTAWGHDVVDVADSEAAKEILHTGNPPQLVIFEGATPAGKGLQVCQEIRSKRMDPYVYLMMLTAKDDRESVVRGLEAGMDDCIPEPLDPVEFRARMLRAQRILDEFEELNTIRRTLAIRATQDSLTGLLNRLETLQALERELARAQREGQSLGVLLVDVDGFKPINDTHGHLAGDAVLKEVAHRLRSSARIYDSIGRYGGDEFLLVLPNCTPTFAESIAERHRVKVLSESISTGLTPLNVTVSIGVAAGTWSQVGCSTSLFQAADAALYRAKRRGRNCVELGTVSETDNGMILEHWEVS